MSLGSHPPRNVPLTFLAIALTFGTGAMDVASFTRLGGVFSSVMTGNLVLLGLAAARPSGDLAAHTALAFAGYVTGAALGTWIAGPSRPHGQTWPVAVTLTLVVELAVMGAFSAGWELTQGQPAGGPQLVLVVVATLGMGLQSAAVRGLGASVSTTYLTGTLTGVVASLVAKQRPHHLNHRSVAILAAVAAGAAVGGALILTAPAILPAVPLATVTVVIAAAAYHHIQHTGTARALEPLAPQASCRSRFWKN
ncbi:MAG: YoaK family protein [Pseudonocardiaceae bacterium]